MSTPAKLSDRFALLLLSCATLLLQVTWTRILSVCLWYHFAFLVISTAMLGFGVSGVILGISRRLAKVDLGRWLPLLSLAQVGLTIAGFIIANRLPFAPFSLLTDGWQWLYAPIYLLCVALPFVTSGLVVALLLSRQGRSAATLYCFDLLGAGLGCLAIVIVMPALGGSGSVLCSAALSAAAASLFGLSRGGQRPKLGQLRAAALLLCLACFGAALRADHWLPLRISPTKRWQGKPVQAVLDSDQRLFSGWTTSSRVDVLPAAGGRAILIDAGTALTRMPHVTRNPQAMGPLRDERSLVLQPALTRSALIIGSGGGLEVLTALRNGLRRVVAVEINPLINRLVTGQMASFVGRIFSAPQVSLNTAEARSFLRRSTERYDAIIAAHTISNAASASGALSLAEEYVLTREAFSDYLEHLSPAGRLLITRPQNQLPRLTATAREALVELGIERPGEHVLLFAHSGFSAGMIVSRTAISPAQSQKTARLLARQRIRPLYLPHIARRGTVYRAILDERAQLQQLYRNHATRLRPATDDRPFFAHRTRWRDLNIAALKRVFSQDARGRVALEDQPVAEVALGMVFVQSTLLAVGLVLLPLWWTRRESLAGGAPSLGYFLLLGLGFILTEIALIQRLTLYIGRPVYTFAVVVGTLLVSSGVGSLISGRLFAGASPRWGRLRWLLAGCAATLLLFNWTTPSLLRATLGLALPWRVVLCVTIVSPLGLLLGMPFPTGLNYLARHRQPLIAWAWGINAVASVVGSVAAIILATLLGFSRVFAVAAVIYLLAVAMWYWMRREEPNREARPILP